MVYTGSLGIYFPQIKGNDCSFSQSEIQQLAQCLSGGTVPVHGDPPQQQSGWARKWMPHCVAPTAMVNVTMVTCHSTGDCRAAQGISVVCFTCTLWPHSSKFTQCRDKMPSNSNVREEGLILFAACGPHPGVRTGTQGRRLGLMQRAWRMAAHWLAPRGLPSLLSYTIQAHLLRGDIDHKELGPPTSLINQENTSRTCPLANPMQAFKNFFLLCRQPQLVSN